MKNKRIVRTLFLPALLFLTAATLPAAEQGKPVDLALPTENTALLEGRSQDFYQFVDRDFNGVKTTPWEGGRYGFVRNPRMTSEGLVYEHFHEGIDIKPVLRDATGMPLDDVHAIADGRVAYVNPNPRWSNYGNYVVVEHLFGGCRYYSLYAHLNRITATVGTPVRKGDKIGVLGFTGEGIDQRRAHLHLELNLLLSPDFETWHRTYFPTEINRHGIYNGLNLAGIDIAGFYLALQKNPALTLPEFLARLEPAFKVAIPANWKIHVARFYPWLMASSRNPGTPSLEISFDSSGLPLKIAPCDKKVTGPELTSVRHSSLSYSILTRNLVAGSGNRYQLSENGLRYLMLLTGPQ
ncbi:MAG: M23 family metallopeptidase [Verrucomicrobiota bacterium]